MCRWREHIREVHLVDPLGFKDEATGHTSVSADVVATARDVLMWPQARLGTPQIDGKRCSVEIELGATLS